MAPFSAYQNLLKQTELNKTRSLERQATNQNLITSLQQYQPPSPIVSGSSFNPGIGGAMPPMVGGNTGSGRAGQVINYAKKWLGVPYSYGGGSLKGPSRGIAHGRNIIGFDCSGLVRQVYAKFGVNLPRVSRQQAAYGKKINPRQAMPGDLVFFSSRGLPVGHVGIYLGGGKMLEAPRTGLNVRVAPVWNNNVVGYRRVL